MIEEYDQNEERLTSDIDIATKMIESINQVMFELARFKKIADYVELEVNEGDLIRFEDIKDESGYEVYQLDKVQGINYDLKANGTIIKALESGTLEIDYFRYPTRITEKNEAKYVFELSQDALEILPYGVAGDIFKTDSSMEYGKMFSDRYEMMLQRLDSRNSTGTFSVEGGLTWQIL